jgi:hypothetical protein
VAKVKIILDKDETLEVAEANLMKALNFHNSGDAHLEEQFIDPAMIKVADKLEKMHADMYESMLKEISEALDLDFKHGHE